MKKLTLSDLQSIESYNAQRPMLRQAMMEHKKTRRVALGPNSTLHFEDYMVMRYQVQELIRVEKITAEADLVEELATYNPLIPDGSNLKVTFMLEYPDEAERKVKLSQLLGIENSISIQIGSTEPVQPIANEDLPRSTDEKTSAVHFLRFEFSAEAIAQAKDGGEWIIKSDHEYYSYQSEALDPAVAQSLSKDFD